MKSKTPLLFLVASLLVLLVTFYGWLSSFRTVFVRSCDGRLVFLLIEPERAHSFTRAAGDKYDSFSLRDWINEYRRGARVRSAGAGFEFFHGDEASLLAIPYPLLALMAAGITVWSLVVMRRQQRRRLRALRGLCASCGYELRGIDSARCPECGRSVSAWVREEFGSGRQDSSHFCCVGIWIGEDGTCGAPANWGLALEGVGFLGF